MMSNDGLIIENMDLSHTHLAVSSNLTILENRYYGDYKKLAWLGLTPQDFYYIVVQVDLYICSAYQYIYYHV